MKQHRVPHGVHPMDVACYLRKAYPMLPERFLREAVRNRDVRVNGTKYHVGQTVQGNDEVTLYIPDAKFDFSLEYALDDGHLLVPIKPQGLPVDIDQDGIGQDTLLSRLRITHPSARLCNRLDAQTGGLVVAAADEETYLAVLETFAKRDITKEYIAMAKGGFSETEAYMHAFLIKDAANSTVQICPNNRPGAKPIETRYRVLWDDGTLAALALSPITGRTHQLRAHMAYIGHPLLDDDKYGDRTLNRNHPGGLKLWCKKIQFSPKGAMAAYHDIKIQSRFPEWFPEFLTEDSTQ